MKGEWEKSCRTGDTGLSAIVNLVIYCAMVRVATGPNPLIQQNICEEMGGDGIHDVSSFQRRKGAIRLFVPHGAGKSTTMKIWHAHVAQRPGARRCGF